MNVLFPNLKIINYEELKMPFFSHSYLKAVTFCMKWVTSSFSDIANYDLLTWHKLKYIYRREKNKTTFKSGLKLVLRNLSLSS